MIPTFGMTILSPYLNDIKSRDSDYDLKLKGGESSTEATERALQALNECLLSDFQKTAIVTHGNLLALILHFFDKPFGFEGWQRLTNPDVYLLVMEDGHHHVKRIWP
ncbi:MAG: histidine phosphatase family protein [Tuberibacillus sp.]